MCELHGVTSWLCHTSRAKLLLVAAAILCSCAKDRAVSIAIRSELAPTGKLRVGLFNKNPVYVTDDKGGNALQGVAPDLSRELARRLSVTFEAIRYPSISPMLEGARNGEWDIAFLGVDAGR